VARAETPLESLVRRWAVPRALFAGVACGFLACCAAGWIASGQSLYRDFVRLHPLIAPEGSFHPTVAQFRALVTSTAPPERVVVIVGGSSVFNGVGQGRDGVWTLRLQNRLGERFRVFNLALRAGAHTQGGAVVAESLVKDGRPLIYVADIPPASAVPPVMGWYYDYLFWDAYHQGLLLPDAVREARLDELVRGFHGARRETLDELRLGARLDGRLRFDDLWTTVGYRWIFTVWNPLAQDRPLAARGSFVDPEVRSLPPFDQRYRDADLDLSLRIARGVAAGHTALDARGRPVADPALPRWQSFRRAIRDDLPRLLRQRTLLVVTGQSPYYLDMLTTEERVLYDLVVERTVTILREVGYESVAVDPRFTVDDYYDRVHLTEAGGAKLAEALAPVIRQMADRLGYPR
jgi:hypothetical protein